jgi:hypothetical protein
MVHLTSNHSVKFLLYSLMVKWSAAFRSKNRTIRLGFKNKLGSCRKPTPPVRMSACESKRHRIIVGHVEQKTTIVRSNSNRMLCERGNPRKRLSLPLWLRVAVDGSWWIDAHTGTTASRLRAVSDTNTSSFAKNSISNRIRIVFLSICEGDFTFSRRLCELLE